MMKPINLINLLTIAILSAAIYHLWNTEWRRESSNHNTPKQPHLKPTRNTNSQPIQVTDVIDGDTLILISGDKVRLCGVDAPEKDQPLGSSARHKLFSLVIGQQIIVEEVERDRYHRKVSEVFISTPDAEILINAEIIKAGMAYVYRNYVNNCPNKDLIRHAELAARQSKLGVWSDNYQRPWKFRKEQEN